jgi:flagellar basal-body rod modification protein FlgD
MDPVSATSAATTQNAQATSTSKNTTLTQQDFLKLFTTQLQHQDPLNPMDSSQMLTQMTQLNTISALGTMTQSIQKMEADQASASRLQAVGLIGKKVEAKGNSLSIDGQGTASGGSYQLAKAGQAYIQIFDENGNLIRVINDGTKDTSKQTFAWDGKTQQGAQLPAGNYAFNVSAIDGNNQPIQVTTSRVATVTGISIQNGVTYLNLGSDQITINDIFAITA